MTTVRILCDGGAEFGFGHLRRAATLAAAFSQHGYRVHVEVLSPEGQALLPSAPSDDRPADIWLIDLPYDGDSWVAQAWALGCRVVALDFIGALAPDLVISLFDRGTAPAGARHRFGFEYAIIRPDVANLAPALCGKGVIVMIGGGDNQGLAEQAALRLHARNCSIVLIDGPLTQKRSPVPTEIMRLSSPNNLAQLMADCEWGVTGGGGAMLEMLCLGKPVHVLPRTEYERAMAKIAFDRGALLGIGLDTLTAPPAELCRQTSRAALTLVDRRGSERIIEAIETLA